MRRRLLQGVFVVDVVDGGKKSAQKTWFNLFKLNEIFIMALISVNKESLLSWGNSK